jgi:hypothetical protein
MEVVDMKYQEMINVVDAICEMEGYEDAPSYNYIFGVIYMMNRTDSVERIKELLKDFNEQ